MFFLRSVSGWLPVPPPPLDINVGMVSSSMVKQAVAYTDRIEVEFSKYMGISSVRNALSLTCNGAAVSNLTIEPLNAEYNLEHTKQYATIFAVTTVGEHLSGSLVVSAANSAVNYAGKPLIQAYTSEVLTASVRPTGIEAPNSVSVDLHGAAGIPVTLQPNAAGQQLVIENLSPALVSVSVSNIATNTDGSTEISVTGNLPGSGLIKVTEPVSGLSKTIVIDVTISGTAGEPEGPTATVLPVTAAL